MCINRAIRARICRQVGRRSLDYLLMVSTKTDRPRVTAVIALHVLRDNSSATLIKSLILIYILIKIVLGHDIFTSDRIL